MLELSNYPPIYLDHFQNPRNVGICDNFTHRAERTIERGFGCFDQIEITLRIKNEIIEEARFHGRLCSGSLAAASLLMTMIEGKSLAEVRSIESKDLAEQWGITPRGKEHSLDFVIATLHDALASNL